MKDTNATLPSAALFEGAASREQLLSWLASFDPASQEERADRRRHCLRFLRSCGLGISDQSAAQLRNMGEIELVALVEASPAVFAAPAYLKPHSTLPAIGELLACAGSKGPEGDVALVDAVSILCGIAVRRAAWAAAKGAA